ncbi:uncharacterized protein LOC135473093 [Liolophura sinensis]|uniref:uncharacterized protein LOC135473093 n=1 Tax=Liolophura sinensis TaxID=3198878 RepID=UPI003158E5C2
MADGSCRASSRLPPALFPLLLLLESSTMLAMSTVDYTNTVVSDEPPMLGECMQILEPSYHKIFDLEQICQNLELYLACYVLDVQEAAAFYPGPLPLDLFHDVHSMKLAYRGVCLDLLAITPNRHCVQEKEPELMKCNEDLNAVSSLLDHNFYDVYESTTYLCRAFQKHASCESLAFSSCDAGMGRAMANFYIAALPTTCKIMLGVNSKYDDIIFGPFWMGIPVECFPEDRETDPASLGTTLNKLCRYYETFIPCLQQVVERRNRTGLLYELGSYDLFDSESQLNAYGAFCPIVNDLGEDLECVQDPNVTVSEACNNDYSEATYELETPELSFQDKRIIMCKATAELLRCEQQAYTSCTDQVKTAYNNYNVAVLPSWCKQVAGISSEFDELPVEKTTKKVRKTTKKIKNYKKPKTTTLTERVTMTESLTDVKTFTTELPATADVSQTLSPPEFMPAYTTDNGQQALRTIPSLALLLIGAALIFT